MTTIQAHILPTNIQCLPEISMNSRTFPGTKLHRHWINVQLRVAPKSLLEVCHNLVLTVGWEVEELGPTLGMGL